MKLLSASLPVIALANQVVRFDDPKFLLTGIFETNDLDASEIFEKFMNGRWCKTLNDFSYPIENDDWTYLQDKPVEKWCKMWRLCRIETKRNEMTCNQVNYRNPKTRGLNQQKGFFAKTNMLAYSADLVNFSDPTHLQSKVLAGHVCETEYNETPCLKKTCNCDLQLADKVLDHVVDYYKQEILANRETETQISQETESVEETNQTPIEVQEEEQETTPVEEIVETEETIEVVEQSEESEDVVDNEEPEENNLNEKVEEIVEDHAKLVEEHTQLVEDIASFKEKVQDVVEEHAKTTMTDLKDSLAPVNESLAQEEELFEASSETIDEAVEVLSEEGNDTQDLLSTLAETSVKAEEMGDNADTMIDDIAAFNQDFVFQDAIKK
jgi:hypothetical protein